MPREIKFRAWMEQHKVMQVIFDSTTQESWFIPNTNLPIMQYTGLKDSSGREIYEGDIVQKAGNRYLIKWCDKTARYVVEVLKAYALLVRGVEFPLWQYVEENGQVNLEVIGNIYEHPELLES